MKIVLFDEKGNVKTFKSETKMEEYLKKHEGIFYIIAVHGNWIDASKIKAENGDYWQIGEGHIEIKD